MEKRFTRVAAIVAAVLALSVSAAVAGTQQLFIPETSPYDEPGIIDPTAAEIEATLDDADVPTPVRHLPETDFSNVPVSSQQLIDAVGEGFDPVSWDGNDGINWADVTVRNAYGDRITITVQGLDAVTTPGGFFEPDWALVTVDGFEAGRDQAAEGNLSRQLWVITDTHQIGVVLAAEPQHRLETPIDHQMDLLESVVRDVIAALR